MRNWQAWVLLTALLLAALSPAPLAQAQTTGDPVRVGLYYGNDTMGEVRLSSAGGLMVGVLPAHGVEISPLIVVNIPSDWRIRHEAIRLEFGPYDSLIGAQAASAALGGAELKYVIAEGARYYVRYGSFDSLDVALRVLSLLKSPYNSGHVIGMYRTASQPFANLDEARALVDMLQQAGQRTDLLYTAAGWLVLVGHSANPAQAEQLGAELAGVTSGARWGVVVPDRNRTEIYQQDGALQGSFAAEVGDIFVGAVNGVNGKPPLVTTYASGSGKQYRGYMQLIQRTGLSYQVNNYLTMDQYLMGVVPREMSWTHPLEALKAQAVAARSYAEYNRGKHASLGFDFCSGVDCQAYADYSWEGAPTQQAVALTSGVIMTYGGKVVAAYFHSDGGGHTENVENVWTYPIPYLQGVPELYPSGSDYQDWDVVLTQSELMRLVAQQKGSVGTITSVEALSYTEAGRVMKLRVTGAKGYVDFDKEQARLRDNDYRLIYRLNSRIYTVKPQIPEVSVLGADGNVVSLNPHGLSVQSAGGTSELKRSDSYNLLGAYSVTRESSAQPQGFVFTGHGFGHGLGMSQWGADAMAKNGHTFEEILKHYYRGVTIEKVGK